MPVKGLQLLTFITACILAGTATWVTASWAGERPQSMLGAFDLKSVILSPEPLGPPAHFEPSANKAEPAPAAAQSEAEPQREAAAAETDANAQATPTPEARPKVAAKPKVAKSDDDRPRKRVSSKPSSKPAVAARKRKSNPLDAYARDTRPLTWPCVGDGICAWKQPR